MNLVNSIKVMKSNNYLSLVIIRDIANNVTIMKGSINNIELLINLSY